MKERTIASYTAKNFRLQLLELTYEDIGSDGMPTDITYIKYQIRLNRSIIETSISEYAMRKLFAMNVQNHILQLKIYSI